MPENAPQADKPSWLQKVLGPIVEQILNRLDLGKRLDALQADAKQEIEELRAQAMQELAVTRDKAFAELEETRDKALAMFKDSLPEMAGAVSKAAVTAVFDHTQIDETTDHVTDVFNNILNGLPFGIGQAR